MAITEHNESKLLSYKVFHSKHRDLLLELLWYAREVSRMKLFEKQEKVENPNVNTNFTPSGERLYTDIASFLGKEVKELDHIDHSTCQIKLIRNDRILPPNILFKCPIVKKSNGLFSNDKKFWLILGLTQVLIAS